MKQIKRLFAKKTDEIKTDQAKGAQREMLEELFNDFYINRRSIYKMNFVRGLFFGFGSALGGMILIAALLWVLSWFVNIPFVGEAVRDAQKSLNP